MFQLDNPSFSARKSFSVYNFLASTVKCIALLAAHETDAPAYIVTSQSELPPGPALLDQDDQGTPPATATAASDEFEFVFHIGIRDGTRTR